MTAASPAETVQALLDGLKAIVVFPMAPTSANQAPKAVVACCHALSCAALCCLHRSRSSPPPGVWPTLLVGPPERVCQRRDVHAELALVKALRGSLQQQPRMISLVIEEMPVQTDTVQPKVQCSNLLISSVGTTKLALIASGICTSMLVP